MMAIDSHEESFNEVEIGDEGESSRAPDLPQSLRHLSEQERAQGLSLRQLFAEQEHGLRQKYANWILWLLGAQFVIADAVFVAFAWVGRSWGLPPGVVEVWLAATVIQVVGVVAIVTRHLFPNRDQGAASA
jgi:glutathione S-transferase